MASKKDLLMKSMCYTLCGAMLLSSPAMSALAAGITETLDNGNTEIAAYITTTPRMMVGDTIRVNLSGVSNMEFNSVTWYRTSTGSYDDADVISGASNIVYTFTADDIGYYIFAVVGSIDNEGETVMLNTNITENVVKAYVAETENWIDAGDGIWQYDVIDGTNEVQVKMVDDAYKTLSEDYDGTVGSIAFGEIDIEVPSSLGGYAVTKLADYAFKGASTWTNNDSTGYGSVLDEITYPEGLVELGANLYNTSDIVVLPSTLEYVAEDAFEDFERVYSSNDNLWHYTKNVERVVVKNPTTYFGDIPRDVSNDYGWSLSTQNRLVTYVGAEGSSIHNIYDAEIDSWLSNGLQTPEDEFYWFEKSGVYSAKTNSAELTEEEQLQQKIDENKENWILSSDGKFYYDVIDGTDLVIVKPAELTENGKVEVPEVLDGYTVGVLVVDTENKKNIVYDIPDSVIIDKGTLDIGAEPVIAGNSGSNAEQIAEDNNLVFVNKDVELETKEQFDAADKSEWYATEDGYWQYRFIDGFDSVEIQNIKSFGEGATVEVPETIDGYTVSVFNPGIDDDYNYADLILPEGIKIVDGNFTTVRSMTTATVYYVIADNVTVYNKDADLSDVVDAKSGSKNPTTITGYTGSTADLVCVNRVDGTTNEEGVLTKTVFIPLDSKTPLVSVAISGTNKAGNDLTASINPSIATADYQWMISDDGVDFKEISGETSEVLSLTDDMAGKYVKVVATATGNFTGEVESTKVQVAASTATALTSLTATYYSNVGKNCTASSLSPSGATATYQWYRDTAVSSASSTGVIPETAELIVGATESTYTVTAEDVGYYLFATATGTGDYYGTVKAKSSTSVINSNTGTVSISSRTSLKYVGDELTTSLSVTDAVVTYQWYRADSANTTTLPDTAEKIVGATSSTYTATDDDLGKYLFVHITGVASEGYGGTDIDCISNPVKATIDSATIDGNGYVGETLTAVTEPEDADATYQWYSRTTNSTSTTNATKLGTGKTYTLTENELGKYVFCAVTGTGNYVTSSSVKTNVIEVTEKTVVALDSVSLTGTSKVGEKLTASVEPADATVEYKWYRADSADATSWTEITGATSSTYTLTSDDEDMYIKVVATGTGDYEGSVEAVSSSSVEAENTVVAIERVTVSGSTKVGQTLTANVYPSTASADIRWLAADTEDGDYEEIGNGKTYTLTEDEVGKYIKAEATNKDDSSNVVLSSATSVVEESSDDDSNVDEYGRIKDSIENVEYVTEDMSEAFIDTEERDCLVYASQGQTFSVIIPKTLQFDGSQSAASLDFTTTVKADISGYDEITVEPEVTSVTMSESTGIKKDIICDLEIGQTKFSIANDTQEALEEGKEANHTASVDGITAGEWKGTFNWLISVKGNQTTDSKEDVEY